MEGATPEALEQLRRIEATADPLRHAAADYYGRTGIAPGTVRWPETADPAGADLSAVPLKWLFVTASKQDPNLFPVGEGFGFFALPFKS